jgi:hypothetical protein
MQGCRAEVARHKGGRQPAISPALQVYGPASQIQNWSSFSLNNTLKVVSEP